MSTSCDAWIDAFLRKFVRRFRPPESEFPRPGTDDYIDMRDDWITALDRRAVTEAEAEAALRRLREDPPAWQRDHLPKLIHAIESARREQQSQGSGDLAKEQAQAESRHCEHCGGSGQAVIFRRGYDGRRVADLEVERYGEIRRDRVAMTATAHCVCPMGRWIRQRTRDVVLLQRVPDLADVLAGRTGWTAADPTRRGDEYGRVTVERARRAAVVPIGAGR